MLEKNRHNLLFIVLLTFLLYACSTRQAEPVVFDFENVHYKFSDIVMYSPEEVILSDGYFKTSYGASVRLVSHAVGKVEPLGEVGVAILAHHGGGTGTFYRLGVFEKNGEALVEIANTWLGDRVIIHLFRIENGQIVLVMTRHGKHDPLCCPTHVVLRKYHAADGKLELLSEELLGTTLGEYCDPPISQG